MLQTNVAGAEETNANLGVRNPGSALALLGATFRLYARFPLLFCVLAAVVVVPYDLVLLAIDGAGPLEQGRLGFVAAQLLMPVDWLLISPLISALHVHAVRRVREGRRPRLLPVFRDGVRVLPVVTAVTFISWLGITAGLVALIVPGVILWMRWSVAAQAAAIDNGGWKAALQSSRLLAIDRWGEVFLLLLLAGVVTSAPLIGLVHLFPRDSTTVVSVSCGVIYSILSRSFSALAIALLFFDLRESRPEATSANAPALIEGLAGSKVALKSPPTAAEARMESPAPTTAPVRPVGNPIDPRSYSDAERPRGWWVDPADPGRMRYWGAGDRRVWAGSIRTPRKLRRAWQT